MFFSCVLFLQEKQSVNFLVALIRWGGFEAVQTYDMRDGLFFPACFLVFWCFHLSLFPLISEGEALGQFSPWRVGGKALLLMLCTSMKALPGELKLTAKLFACVLALLFLFFTMPSLPIRYHSLCQCQLITKPITSLNLASFSSLLSFSFLSYFITVLIIVFSEDFFSELLFK